MKLTNILGVFTLHMVIQAFFAFVVFGMFDTLGMVPKFHRLIMILAISLFFTVRHTVVEKRMRDLQERLK